MTITTTTHSEVAVTPDQPNGVDTSFNGWHNFETWAVALWLDNEQSSYEYVRELAREHYQEATETAYATRGQAAAWALADTLRAEHEDANPLTRDYVPASVFVDLLSSALEAVDWHEVAHHYITEVVAEGE